MKRAIVLATAAIIGFASAADARSSVNAPAVLGHGVPNCATYLVLGDAEHWSTAYWIQGYVTALETADVVYNKYAGPSFIQVLTPQSIVRFVADYCDQHTMESVSDAATALYMSVRKPTGRSS